MSAKQPVSFLSETTNIKKTKLNTSCMIRVQGRRATISGLGSSSAPRLHVLAPQDARITWFCQYRRCLIELIITTSNKQLQTTTNIQQPLSPPFTPHTTSNRNHGSRSHKGTPRLSHHPPPPNPAKLTTHPILTDRQKILQSNNRALLPKTNPRLRNQQAHLR